jgi:FMN-dependent NADH-azoreductase
MLNMSKLLYIKASPRGADSRSSAVADTYLAALRERLSNLSVDTLDLVQEKIPDFDGDKVDAKMAVITGQANEGRQKTAWDEITAVANRFIAADRYLIAVPMWNGGIPYRLKQYIDVIHQPGLLWGLDPQTGYFGLLKNKKAVLALTSGAYGPSMPSPAFGVDHHSTYLRDWLNQAGVTDIEEIRFQPTLLTSNPEASFKAAMAAAQSLAARA